MSYAVYVEKISETMNPILPKNIWKSMYVSWLQKVYHFAKKKFFINEEKKVR